jgi:hypothetical protein
MNEKQKKLIMLLVLVVLIIISIERLGKYNRCMETFTDDELQVLAAVLKNISYCNGLEEGSIETSTCTDPSISRIKCVDQVYFFNAIAKNSTVLCMDISFPCMEDMCVNVIRDTCDNITIDKEDIYYCKAWKTFNLSYCDFLNYNRTRGDSGCEGGTYLYKALSERDPSFCRQIKNRDVKMFCNSLAYGSTEPVFSRRKERCFSQIFSFV